jgi:hypothetical protein
MAAADQRFAVVGLQLQRPLEARQRFLRLVELRQCRAPAAERLDVAGVERQCPVEAGGGLVSATETQESETEIQQGAGRIWIDAQGFPDSMRILLLSSWP